MELKKINNKNLVIEYGYNGYEGAYNLYVTLGDTLVYEDEFSESEELEDFLELSYEDVVSVIADEYLNARNINFFVKYLDGSVIEISGNKQYATRTSSDTSYNTIKDELTTEYDVKYCIEEALKANRMDFEQMYGQTYEEVLAEQNI